MNKETSVQKPTQRWGRVFDVGSTVLVIVLAAVIVWQGRARLSDPHRSGPAETPLPTEPIDIGGSATIGSSDAPMAIVEYADFECSYCAKFAREVKPALRKEYIDTGRLLFVFKHFPLSNHPHAPTAARAAWCAGRQSKFWEMHDGLFSLSGRLDRSVYEKMAATSGVEMGAFSSCLSSPESQLAVEKERSEGEHLRVMGTPRFFFGVLLRDGRVEVSAALSGAKPLSAFRDILEGLL